MAAAVAFSAVVLLISAGVLLIAAGLAYFAELVVAFASLPHFALVGFGPELMFSLFVRVFGFDLHEGL